MTSTSFPHGGRGQWLVTCELSQEESSRIPETLLHLADVAAAIPDITGWDFSFREHDPLAIQVTVYATWRGPAAGFLNESIDMLEGRICSVEGSLLACAGQGRIECDRAGDPYCYPFGSKNLERWVARYRPYVGDPDYGYIHQYQISR